MDYIKDVESTIIVQIPSYRDEQLVPTVTSALAQAENPDRVHFAICYQDDDMRDYETLSLLKNVKLVHVPLSEARGSCYARWSCQRLIDGEDYSLRIDSHMRFVKHWDTQMIRMWAECGDPKAVLSTYPPALKKEMLTARVTDHMFDTPARGSVTTLIKMRTGKEMLRHCNAMTKVRSFRADDVRPKRCILVTGCFVFSKAQLELDVPFDPNMFFFGDELPMALRTYTHGYTVYAPPEMYVYHYCMRPTRKMPSSGAPAVVNVRTHERERFMSLFGAMPRNEKPLDLGEYGLGKERSLEDFERDSGLSLRCGSVSRRAFGGYYYDDEMANGDGLSHQNKISSDAYVAMRTKGISVVVPCSNMSDADECIKNARATAARPMHLRFIVAAEEGANGDLPKSRNTIVTTVPKGSMYGAYIASAVAHVPDGEIVVIADPGMIFAESSMFHAWDEEIIWQLVSSGNSGKNTIIAQHVLDSSGKVGINQTCRITGFQNASPVYADGCTNVKHGSYFPSLYNDMIAAYVDIFKSVPPDPSLCREDFQLSCAIRFWTSGYDIYHIPDTYISAREGCVKQVGKPDRRSDLIKRILGYDWDYFYDFLLRYEYGPGDVRSTTRWELEMGVEYDRYVMLD